MQFDQKIFALDLLTFNVIRHNLGHSNAATCYFESKAYSSEVQSVFDLPNYPLSYKFILKKQRGTKTLIPVCLFIHRYSSICQVKVLSGNKTLKLPAKKNSPMRKKSLRMGRSDRIQSVRVQLLQSCRSISPFIQISHPYK